MNETPNPEIRHAGEILVGEWYHPFADLTSLPREVEGRFVRRGTIPDMLDIPENPSLNWNFRFQGIEGRVIPGTDNVDDFRLGDLDYSQQPLGEIQPITWTKMQKDKRDVIIFTEFPITPRVEFDLRTPEDRDRLEHYYMEFQIGDLSFYYNCGGDPSDNNEKLARSYDLEDEDGEFQPVLIPYSLQALQRVRVRIVSIDQEDAIDNVQIDPSNIGMSIRRRKEI